jgi:hypothetical protein
MWFVRVELWATSARGAGREEEGLHVRGILTVASYFLLFTRKPSPRSRTSMYTILSVAQDRRARLPLTLQIFLSFPYSYRLIHFYVTMLTLFLEQLWPSNFSPHVSFSADYSFNMSTLTTFINSRFF